MMIATTMMRDNGFSYRGSGNRIEKKYMMIITLGTPVTIYTLYYMMMVTRNDDGKVSYAPHTNPYCRFGRCSLPYRDTRSC